MSKVKTALASVGTAVIGYTAYQHLPEFQQAVDKTLPYAVKVAEYTVKETIKLIDKLI